MECVCPFCERVTRHVVRADDIAVYAWCQECFRVHVLEDDRVVHLHFHQPVDGRFSQISISV